jgi:hypothetical protein
VMKNACLPVLCHQIHPRVGSVVARAGLTAG